MKEPFSGYLAKLVGKKEGPVTFLVPERATMPKKISNNSQKSNCSTLRGKGCDQVSRAVGKTKKYRIPFVALALALLLALPCFIFLVAGLRPVALADKLTHLDASPTVDPGSPESAPPDQTVSELQSMGNLTLGYGATCDQFHTVTGDKFCWNESDFQWGARDSTCIYNPSVPNHPASVTAVLSPKNLVGNVKGMTWTHTPASTSINLPSAVLNQNTCTDNSTCVSDNSSNNDNPNQDIHGHTGGDDIVCGNNACTSDSVGSTTQCGDPSGKRLDFDRFGCQMVDNNFDFNGDAKTVPFIASLKGVAINPTAYDPNGAVYVPTTFLYTGDILPRSTQNRPVCGSNNRWSCANSNGSTPNLVVYQAEGNFVIQKGQRQIVTIGSNVPVFWIVCDDVGGGWAFPCSDTTASNSMPFISTEDKTQSLDNGKVSEGFIKNDWLSGNANPASDGPSNSAQIRSFSQSGHLEYTYQKDTISQPGIQKLFPYMVGIGFILITPVIVMIGYQFIWASWIMGRVNGMEAFGRVLLSILAIVVSDQLAAMLIQLVDSFNMAVVNFHVTVGYTDITIGSQTSTFTLAPQGENDPASFRGIVVPISRWGCIANDFVALLSNKFWTDMAGYIPFVGGIAKFIGNIFNAIDVAKHIGEFAVLLLSISLCTQVFMRIVLLNYYVLTGPVAFGCWGLPGGVGSRVVNSWTKGFLSLLFSQTVQIFVLTTFPLILPAFPSLPSDRFGLLNVVFQALPRILVLTAALSVPKVMGTGATKAIAQAGTVVAGAVAAAGAAAMNAV
jgi:hypothetical protein